MKERRHNNYAFIFATAATMITMTIVAAMAHKPSALMLKPNSWTDNFSDMAKLLRGAKRHRA
jgi:hypothetical protein